MPLVSPLPTLGRQRATSLNPSLPRRTRIAKANLSRCSCKLGSSRSNQRLSMAFSAASLLAIRVQLPSSRTVSLISANRSSGMAADSDAPLLCFDGRVRILPPDPFWRDMHGMVLKAELRNLNPLGGREGETIFCRSNAHHRREDLKNPGTSLNFSKGCWGGRPPTASIVPE